MSQSSQSTASLHLNVYADETNKSYENERVRVDEMVQGILARRNSFTDSSLGEMEASTLGSPLRFPNKEDLSSLVSFPLPATPTPRKSTFHALQQWEGHVVDFDEDEFVAWVVDLTAGHTNESEEAIIPMSEISDRDASNIGVGSIFRWVIGYERSPEGTQKRVSQIVFRDLPRMTESDLRKGADWAQKIALAFNR